MKTRYVPLYEKFLDAVNLTTLSGPTLETKYVEFFENPTIKELNSCPNFAKAIIDRAGNVIVINSEYHLHQDLVRYLEQLHYNNVHYVPSDLFFDASYKYFLAIERVEDSNMFGLSTSYRTEFSMDRENEIESYYIKAKKKNPSLDFIFEEFD